MNWSCLLILHGFDKCSDTTKLEFQRLVTAQAALLTVVVASRHTVYNNKAYKLLSTLFNSGKASADLYIDTIVNMEPGTNSLLIGSYLIKYLAENRKSDLVNKCKVSRSSNLIKLYCHDSR